MLTSKFGLFQGTKAMKQGLIVSQDVMYDNQKIIIPSGDGQLRGASGALCVHLVDGVEWEHSSHLQCPGDEKDPVWPRSSNYSMTYVAMPKLSWPWLALVANFIVTSRFLSPASSGSSTGSHNSCSCSL